MAGKHFVKKSLNGRGIRFNTPNRNITPDKFLVISSAAPEYKNRFPFFIKIKVLIMYRIKRGWL